LSSLITDFSDIKIKLLRTAVASCMRVSDQARVACMDVIAPDAISELPLVERVLGHKSDWKCKACRGQLCAVADAKRGIWKVGLPQSCIAPEKCVARVIMVAEAVREIMFGVEPIKKN
jgi:hypothetical protein